jgi:hypothetical protein
VDESGLSHLVLVYDTVGGDTYTVPLRLDDSDLVTDTAVDYLVVGGGSGRGGGGDTRTAPDGKFAAGCGTSAMPQDGGSGIVVLRMPTAGLVHVDVQAAEEQVDTGTATELAVTVQNAWGAPVPGLAARSTVRVWLFSTPTLLAELTTDDLGAVVADDIPLPEQVTSCAHTFQLVGRDAQGREVALSLGLWVLPDPFPFADVGLDAPAAPAIGCLAARGLVLGTGPAPGTGASAFAGEAGVTRGQAATMISRWQGFEVAPPETVGGRSGPTTHADALIELARRGMVRGFADGTLRPAQVLTRGQAASMLLAAAGPELSDPDTAPTSGVHGPALDALAAAGALAEVGDGGVSDANAAVTRAELAMMLAVVVQFAGGGG